MALARLVTFVPLTLAKSADVNGEFNNILNNPVALISPSTGAINFNLQAHTNLIPAAITGTSGSTGNVLTIGTSGGAVWAVPGAVLTTTPKVLQMVSGGAIGPVSAASTVMTDAGISINITPASTNSRVAITYAAAGQAANFTGVNNVYQAQLATSTGALTGTLQAISAPSAAGGIGAQGALAWTLVVQTTATGPIGYKVQHLSNTSSAGGIGGNITAFNGYLVEYSS